MNTFRILISIHHPLSRQGTAHEVTRCLGGVTVHMRSFDDLPRGAFGRATPFAYPLFATNFVRHHADEFDISRGDGCYMRRPRANQLLMVIRSHGLVNMAHAEQIAATKRGDITLPWKCLRAS